MEIQLVGVRFALTLRAKYAILDRESVALSQMTLGETMSDRERRVDLRFGDFALSVQGFEDPVAPMKRVLRLVQRVVEDTPEISRMRLAFDEEMAESLLEDLKARLGLPEERLEVTPGLIIATYPDHAAGAPSDAAPISAHSAAEPVSDAPVLDAGSEPYDESEPESEHQSEPALGLPGEREAISAEADDPWDEDLHHDADAPAHAAGPAADPLSATESAFGRREEAETDLDPAETMDPSPLAAHLVRTGEPRVVNIFDAPEIASPAPPDGPQDDDAGMPADRFHHDDLADDVAEEQAGGHAGDQARDPAADAPARDLFRDRDEPARQRGFERLREPDEQPPSDRAFNIFADPDAPAAPSPRASEPRQDPNPERPLNIFDTPRDAGHEPDIENTPPPRQTPPPWPGLDLSQHQPDAPPLRRTSEPMHEAEPEAEPDQGDQRAGGSSRFDKLVARYRSETETETERGTEPAFDAESDFGAPSWQTQPPADGASDPGGEPAEYGQGSYEEPAYDDVAEGGIDTDITAAELAELDGASTVTDLLAIAAAWLSIVQGQDRFARRDVMAVFDEIPGDHPRSLEARIKGYGKLVRNGVIELVDDGYFALSDDQRERYTRLLQRR